MASALGLEEQFATAYYMAFRASEHEQNCGLGCDAALFSMRPSALEMSSLWLWPPLQVLPQFSTWPVWLWNRSCLRLGSRYSLSTHHGVQKMGSYVDLVSMILAWLSI